METMTLYNDTFIDTCNTFLCQFGGLDNVKPGLLGMLIVISLFIVVLSSMIERNWSSLIVFASFLSVIVSGYLFFSQATNIKPFAISMVFMVASMILKKWLDD